MRSYSSGEVAKICDVTSRTVIRWIEAGKLQAFKLPGRGNNRVAQDDLLTFLKTNDIPVPSELTEKNERKCVVLSSDDYLLKHVKRMVIDADFIPVCHGNPFNAGLEIAAQRPTLVVLDADIDGINPIESNKLMQQLFDQTPACIVFSASKRFHSAKQFTNMLVLAKPIAFNGFAHALEKLGLIPQ
uniref:helix-turn-helix domain-containing protein n=1 Tax=Ningiella ruwaisensis TaxID=2364274 RepID=UPI0010A07466|nr:helix-turn-helix domain-containing protein [Ningiella ruwaisensis]